MARVLVTCEMEIEVDEVRWRGMETPDDEFEFLGEIINGALTGGNVLSCEITEWYEMEGSDA